MMTTSGAFPSVVPPQAAAKDLARRLEALAELVRIGKSRPGTDGFSDALISDSEALLKRAGERLRLSGNHTVVALAGGTGSGKSTLFNALSGTPFSPPGVTRPTTRNVHACVWGMQGAAPLLDWLGVERRHRYARASALDSGESALNGLILLDLPDHDSVLATSVAAVDRLSKLADMLVFVVDPQKYADASLHRRYLVPLAGHASVITVVLNQVDLLSPEQVTDCEQDLRRLLDSEGLHDAHLLSISARTGDGLDALRKLLKNAVAAQYSASERISADIDSLIGGFAIHSSAQIAPERALASLLGQPHPGGDSEPADSEATGDESESLVHGTTVHGTPVAKPAARAPWETVSLQDEPEPLQAPVAATRPPWEDARPDGSADAEEAIDPVTFVPGEPASALTEELSDAAGISAVAQAIASAREAQAARFTGWPLARIGRSRRDPVRELRETAAADALDEQADGTGSQSAAGPAALRDTPLDFPSLGAGAPSGARQSQVDNAITRFSDSVGAQLPPSWKRSLRDAARSGSAQVPGVLATAVREASADPARVPGWWRLISAWQWLLIAIAVAAVGWSAVIAAGHGSSGRSALLSDTSLIPWLLVTAAAVLILGWLTAAACQNMVLAVAEREQERVETQMHAKVEATARDLILAPAGLELAEYELFRTSLEAAQSPAR